MFYAAHPLTTWQKESLGAYITKSCKKYTQKRVNSRLNSQNWSKWAKKGQNFAFSMLKSTLVSSKNYTAASCVVVTNISYALILWWDCCLLSVSIQQTITKVGWGSRPHCKGWFVFVFLFGRGEGEGMVVRGGRCGSRRPLPVHYWQAWVAS